MQNLSSLNELTSALPDANRFLQAYIKKEAVLTSEIEGINTTLLDIFTQPLLSTKPTKSIKLALNYTNALSIAVKMTMQEKLPISSRVILASHKALMANQGEKSSPGSYRKQSVSVGDMVPAPATKVSELMSDLENFINSNELPALIKAGLAHVQFETIHPFLDGNGRIGRLLIVLMLLDNNMLSQPIIYPSYYFKKYQASYYAALDRVGTDGDFEGWLKFYLKIISDSSHDAYVRINEIKKIWKQAQELIVQNFKSKKLLTRLQALSVLASSPIINIKELSIELSISFNTSKQIIDDFVNLGFLVEESYKQRGKLYKFEKYFDVLER